MIGRDDQFRDLGNNSELLVHRQEVEAVPAFAKLAAGDPGQRGVLAV